MLGTAGGLDLRLAANDHFAGAICAAADACAAAVCSIFCRYLSISLNGDLGAALFAAAAYAAADHCKARIVAPKSILISIITFGIHLIRSVHLSVAGDGNAGLPAFITFISFISASADAAIGVDHSIPCDHDIFSRTATISAADPALGIHRTAIDLNMFGTTPVRSANGSAIQI